MRGFQPDVSDWETGKKLPDTATLIRIGEALNVPVGYFYTDLEQPTDINNNL
jgi:transcriptional regulator with XRE-family HTH domain